MSRIKTSDAKTLVIAFVTAAVTAGIMAAAPTIAATFDAQNADKVDSKHAVGCSATTTARANKLVAACADGRLPNNIIAQAPNAAKLQGNPATAFLQTADVHETPIITIDSSLGATSQPLLSVGPISYSGSCAATANPEEDELKIRVASSEAGATYVDYYNRGEVDLGNSPAVVLTVIGTDFALHDFFRVQRADGSYQVGAVLYAVNDFGDDCAASLLVTEYDAPA